jgi:hypothetical protein
VGTARRAGVTRRMGLAENNAAVVAVESEDMTAAKTMTAGKMGADTAEAEAATAKVDATVEAEVVTEDMTVSKEATEESV